MFRRQSRLRREFLLSKSQKTRFEKTIAKKELDKASFHLENLKSKYNQTHKNFGKFNVFYRFPDMI